MVRYLDLLADILFSLNARHLKVVEKRSALLETALAANRDVTQRLQASCLRLKVLRADNERLMSEIERMRSEVQLERLRGCSCDLANEEIFMGALLRPRL
jgi:hypothetical protein